MDDTFESLDVVDHDEQTPLKPRITLKLPSLKALKSKKVPRPPRPAKLKPLKEVLSKLIAQIKKKDDYAFFLQPVNVAEVPGYMSVVKRPMDFGTVSNKVAKGKYRSLEEFTNDVRLVTDNAKAFNIPGSIYYTEADRIEQYALDAIARSSSSVIQYETDWNIDVENENDMEPEVSIEDDEDNVTPMDIDEPGPSSRRSQSVLSSTNAGGLNPRRSTRGPYKKHSQQHSTEKALLLDTIDIEGRLPGSKDGLAAFPPKSDLARTMLALKLKGKKYKTKKERLRFEKEGPPLHGDGSLDYWEMEDPFNVMQALVPEPISRPYVTPLYSQPERTQHESRSSATPQPPPPQTSNTPLGAITLCTNPGLHIPQRPIPNKHWSVQRNFSSRGFKKEEEKPHPTHEREVHTLDWGSLSVLAGELAVEMKRRGVPEENSIDIIREQLDPGENVKKRRTQDQEDIYWNLRRAADGEDYLRDMVYGGVDGYAYVQSLAQFVTRCKPKREFYNATWELGMPLAQYVVENIVDPITEGQHSLLRATAKLLDPHLPRTDVIVKSEPGELVSSLDPRGLKRKVHASEFIYPMIHMRSQKIDMDALIKQPEEVLLSEDVWQGKRFRKAEAVNVETSEELEQVLKEVEKMLNDMLNAQTKTLQTGEGEETEETKRLRLNLLALAKRVPRDMISLSSDTQDKLGIQRVAAAH